MNTELNGEIKEQYEKIKICWEDVFSLLVFFL